MGVTVGVGVGAASGTRDGAHGAETKVLITSSGFKPRVERTGPAPEGRDSEVVLGIRNNTEERLTLRGGAPGRRDGPDTGGPATLMIDFGQTLTPEEVAALTVETTALEGHVLGRGDRLYLDRESRLMVPDDFSLRARIQMVEGLRGVFGAFGWCVEEGEYHGRGLGGWSVTIWNMGGGRSNNWTISIGLRWGIWVWENAHFFGLPGADLSAGPHELAIVVQPVAGRQLIFLNRAGEPVPGPMQWVEGSRARSAGSALFRNDKRPAREPGRLELQRFDFGPARREGRDFGLPAWSPDRTGGLAIEGVAFWNRAVAHDWEALAQIANDPLRAAPEPALWLPDLDTPPGGGYVVKERKLSERFVKGAEWNKAVFHDARGTYLVLCPASDLPLDRDVKLTLGNAPDGRHGKVTLSYRNICESSGSNTSAW